MTILLALLQLGASNYAIDAPMPMPMTGPTTRPTFADEFSARTIDTANWRFDVDRNPTGWPNNELEYYADNRPANSRIKEGALVIEAHREKAAAPAFADGGGQDYTSAKLVSRRAFGYGFYEIRAKLPCGRGTWPAIWLLPPGGSWPDMGEIDIMEMVGWDPNVIHATLHSGKYNHRLGTQRGAEVRVPTACTAWHRYQLDWTQRAITIGVDGHAYMRVANTAPGDHGAWPFDRPYHLILNLAIGGDWGGKEGVDDAALPQAMTIDYVRYWQAK